MQNIVASEEDIQINDLSYSDIVFVSTNSIDLFFKNIKNAKLVASSCFRVWCFGESSANLLKSYEIKAKTTSNSEELWKKICGLNCTSFLIVGGVGGREFLANKLNKAKIKNRKIEIYTRVNINYDSGILQNAINDVNAIILSSGEALGSLVDNLKKIDKKIYLATMKKTIILNSSRVYNIATNLGFKNILVANGARDKDFLDVIKKLQNNDK
jgi:uroporphyrinogen-III synthase